MQAGLRRNDDEMTPWPGIRNDNPHNPRNLRIKQDSAPPTDKPARP